MLSEVGIAVLISVSAAMGLVVLWLCRRRQRTDAPLCRGCGYNVSGLPSTICPECGKDLNVVGIIRPGELVAASLWWRLLVWTLAMACAAPPLVWLGMRFGPNGYVEQQAVELIPRSGAYSSADVYYGGWGLWQPVPLESVKCILEPPNKISVVLEVNGNGRGYACPGEKWEPMKRSFGFDESVVLGCMRTGAVDTTRPDVQAEAAELTRIIRGIADGTGRTIKPVNFTFGTRLASPQRVTPSVFAEKWAKKAYIATCAILWLGGCRRLARRRTA